LLEGFEEEFLLRKFFDDAGEHTLNNVHHIVLVHKTHFHIQLGKLGLTVSALVFVSKAAGYLVVALIAGNHQELFQLLGALGQRVKFAGMDAAGNQIIPGAFRRAFEEDGCFDFNKAFLS